MSLLQALLFMDGEHMRVLRAPISNNHKQLHGLAYGAVGAVSGLSAAPESSTGVQMSSWKSFMYLRSGVAG